MEQIKKLAASVKELQETVEAVEKSTSSSEITKLDAKIGATLHSIQYGTGVCAIAIKQAVDLRKREVRTGVVSAPVENKIQEEKTEIVEEEAPKKEAPKKKKGRKSKKASK